jgi:hypothetical protein
MTSLEDCYLEISVKLRIVVLKLDRENFVYLLALLRSPVLKSHFLTEKFVYNLILEISLQYKFF